MSLFGFLARPRSAPQARDRLRALMAHERAMAGGGDLLAVLQQEILSVIARHITIDREKVMVRMDRGETASTLEIRVETPHWALAN